MLAPLKRLLMVNRRRQAESRAGIERNREVVSASRRLQYGRLTRILDSAQLPPDAGIKIDSAGEGPASSD